MQIELVKEEDLFACATISVRAWQETYRGIVDDNYLDGLDIEARYNKFKSNYQLAPFIVAKIDNEVVGFCRYMSKEMKDYSLADAELTVLYVKPELKRQGIGKALVNYVIKDLKNNGNKGIIVKAIKGNKIGEAFYIKMGAKKLGEDKMLIGDKYYKENVFFFDLR